jgi:hypothetical protein
MGVCGLFVIKGSRDHRSWKPFHRPARPERSGSARVRAGAASFAAMARAGAQPCGQTGLKYLGVSTSFISSIDQTNIFTRGLRHRPIAAHCVQQAFMFGRKSE